MAGSFGGVIKLGGVFEYQNALRNVIQSLRETGSELKLISSEFAFPVIRQSQLLGLTQIYLISHKYPQILVLLI